MAKGRKIFYTMGQVSEMFDLPASTIRFWETRFSILRPKKNAKGNRLFTPQDVENLKLIYHLTKEKKMTLAGAEKFLMQKRVAAKGEMSLLEVLQRVRATLLEIRQELETAENRADNEVVVKSEQVEDVEPLELYGEQTQDEPQTEIQYDSIEAEKPRYIELTLF